MDKIALIKAEIERLYNGEAPKHDQQCNFNDGYFTGIDTIAQFIDTLEPEKPTNQEGLKEEISRTYHDGSVADTSDMDHVTYENIAEYFYDLGCTRTAEKYDEIEYNRQRAEDGVPKDLEEAAEKYLDELFGKGKHQPFYKELFIAGAKWQKEQDTREMIMSDGSYFQKCYELGKKDILSKFTKEHLEGLKWIERTGISTQPIPYHKYCKDLYKVLEEILKEKYDTQGDTSI